jgi:hypothetical protein
VCATYGADCLDGIDNVSDPGLECIPKDPDPDDCDTEGRNTEICVCSRVSAL